MGYHINYPGSFPGQDIPDATPKSGGLMTAQQASQLAAVGGQKFAISMQLDFVITNGVLISITPTTISSFGGMALNTIIPLPNGGGLIFVFDLFASVPQNRRYFSGLSRVFLQTNPDPCSGAVFEQAGTSDTQAAVAVIFNPVPPGSETTRFGFDIQITVL
jgi:hypothetical protein